MGEGEFYYRFYRNSGTISLNYSKSVIHIHTLPGPEAAEAGVQGQGLGGGVCSQVPAPQANQDRLHLDQQWRGRATPGRGCGHSFEGYGVPEAV